MVIFAGITSLDKWLTQKERMMLAIGTINVDPKVIDNQLIQIEVFISSFCLSLYSPFFINHEVLLVCSCFEVSLRIRILPEIK